MPLIRLPHLCAVVVVLLCLLCDRPAAAGKVVDRIVAVVGDRIILLSEVQESAAPHLRTIEEKDPLVRARSEAKILHDTCEAMVDDVLVEEEATSLNIMVTTAEIDLGVVSVAKANSVTVPRLMELAREQGYDEHSYRSSVRYQLLAGKVIQLRGDMKKPEEAVERLHAELRSRVYIEVRISS